MIISADSDTAEKNMKQGCDGMLMATDNHIASVCRLSNWCSYEDNEKCFAKKKSRVQQQKDSGDFG